MLNDMEKIEACRTSEYYKTGEKGKPFIIIIWVEASIYPAWSIGQMWETIDALPRNLQFHRWRCKK